jgi:hypothetical protein
LRDRRYGFFAYTASVYLGALVVWSLYIVRIGASAAPVQADATGAVSAVSGTARSLVGMFSLPNALSAYRTSLHLALIPSWSNGLVVILAVAAMVRWRRLPVFLQDCALAVLLSLVLRAVTGQIQGEGWGYRFLYAHLGMIALLATSGVATLREAVGRKPARRLLAFAAAGAVVLQLPIRWKGVESIVAPYRDGFEWMSTLPYDAVLYPARSVAWGRQQVQNDPFGRNRPMIVDMAQLSVEQVKELQKTAGIHTVTLSRSELQRRGFPASLVLFGGLIIER